MDIYQMNLRRFFASLFHVLAPFGKNSRKNHEINQKTRAFKVVLEFMLCIFIYAEKIFTPSNRKAMHVLTNLHTAIKTGAAIILALCASTSLAKDPQILRPEEPAVLVGHKLEPFEIAPGTFISLTLLTPSDVAPIAQVSSNIYDRFNNVAIPVGSRLLGEYKGKKNERHLIQWTRLQLPSYPGTLTLVEPLLATMPDGSAGITKLTAGSRIGTLTSTEFIVPH